MRDETAKWLAPLLARDIDLGSLIERASMPAVESDLPLSGWLARTVPRTAAVDWIRLGQLIIDDDGLDYPPHPEDR